MESTDSSEYCDMIGEYLRCIVEKDWEELTQEQLEELRICIQTMLRDYRDHVENEQMSQVVELDQSRMGRLARIDAIQSQQAAKKQVNRIKREIKLLEHAQARLRGAPQDFGYCTDCDELIPLPRLMMRPFERRCVPCIQESESR